MANREARNHNPWLPAFVFSLTMFAGSLVGLTIVVSNAIGGSETAAGAFTPGRTPEPGTTPQSNQQLLTYSGMLPAGLEAQNLVAVAPGGQPDISFSAGDGAEQVVSRMFVPVVAIGAGVDTLTKAQLATLVSGATTDWSEVGGVAGKVTYVVAGPEADQEVVATFFDGAEPAKAFPTYETLRAAMTMDSGLLALVPLSEVRVSMTAIAIDGVDVVRGRGDAGVWPFVENTWLVGLSDRGNDSLEAVKASIAVQPPKVTHVVATGDILMSRCTLAKIEATGDWGAALRGPMAEYLAAQDLTLGSLDGSIQDVGTPYLCVDLQYPNLTSPPQVMEALTLAGFDGMTVATNHIFDCGKIACGSQAFLQTLDRLAAAGIKTVGGGRNLEEALAPAIFDVNGVKFGVLGFDDIAAEDLEATADEVGTAPMDDSYADEKAALPHEPAFYKPAEMLHVTQMQERIRALKAQVDVVIVQIQSGYEDTHEASPRSIKGLRAAADAGADLVVGNQGHWVQSAEVRGNTFIDYALGNFIFDQTHTPEHTEGYLLEASFWGKQLVNVKMIPYHIVDKYKPTFVDGDLRAKILGDVFTASELLPAP